MFIRVVEHYNAMNAHALYVLHWYYLTYWLNVNAFNSGSFVALEYISLLSKIIQL